MLNKCVIIPGSPALLPELAPQSASSHAVLDAAISVVAECVGGVEEVHIVGSRDKRWYTTHTGSFRAWGAPHVQVSAGNYLPELVARYVLSRAGVGTEMISSVRDTIVSHAAGVPTSSGVLTVIVVDGSAGLTARAPLALLASSFAADAWCKKVLSGQGQLERNSDSLQQWLKEAGVVEPDLWVELACTPITEERLHVADTSLGVARYVASFNLRNHSGSFTLSINERP